MIEKFGCLERILVNKTLPIFRFISNELKDYAIYDNERNIPHIADGLKLSQRKVVYAGQDVKKIKRVDMFGMKAAEMTHYNHTADSIIGTVAKLVQTFPGSNNLPLLQGTGQFGTRLDNEASSPRYIHAMLSGNFNKMFNKQDQEILTWNYSEGDQIEPVYFMPKLPILLINGSSGVGNGFSCDILPYSVESVKKAVYEVMKTGFVQTKLIPHMNGWTGTIFKNEEGQASFHGKYEIVNKTTIKITELPPKQQLKKYKALLLDLMQKGIIKSFKNKSGERSWEFIITAPRETVALPEEKIKKLFDLVERKTETITCWDVDGRLRVFDNVEQVVERWVEVRLEHYEKRRLNIISTLEEEVRWSNLKCDFIRYWNENAENLIKLKKGSLVHAVQSKFNTVSEDDIDRLLSMRISSLTADDTARLEAEAVELNRRLVVLRNTSAKEMMVDELASV